MQVYLTRTSKVVTNKYVGSAAIGNLEVGKRTFVTIDLYVSKEELGVYSLYSQIDVISGDTESNRSNNDYELPLCFSVSLEDGTDIPVITELTGDPVNTATGNYTIRVTDLLIAGKAPIEFIRSYNGTDYKTSSVRK